MNVLRLLVASVLVVISGTATSPVSADPIYNSGYDLDWVTIRSPGNVAFPGHRQTGAFAGRGVVNYRYRIMRTEITATHYLEFIEAYVPFYEGDPSDFDFTGEWINAYREGNGWRFEIRDGYDNVSNPMQLRMAARFANWYHNGKVNEQWAFESGVYDASTFTRNANGTYNDDYTRADGARFWIPSLDEFLKAVYYDPDHDGPGQEGWWVYPNSTDERLLSGWPGEGETSGGLSTHDPIPVGSYPDMLSPWGLLDGSGAMSEMTQDGWLVGSSMYDSPIGYWYFDEAGSFKRNLYHHPANVFDNGFRLAGAIPSPTSVLPLISLIYSCRSQRAAS